MEKEPIQNWTGKIIGWISTDSQGNQVVMDFGHRILGKYDARLDITTDFYGRQVARGNRVMMFIRDE